MTKREPKRPRNQKFDAFESDLCDALSDVFYAIDSEFRLRRWNDRLSERTGYSDDELAEMSPLALVPEDERPVLEKATRKVLEQGVTQTVESHLLTEDGQRIPHEFNGSPITDESGTVVGLAGTARNIAERKRRENERKQYETLFETINDGVFVLDADLRYTAVNDAFAAMAGYDRDQLLGLHASVLSTEEDFKRGEQLAVEITSGKQDVAALDSELVRKDGALLPVETRFALLQADDAETVVGVVRDVSKRKRRERTLRKHRDELETLNHINVVIRELVWALVSAATREEVERTVCDYLADSDLYRFAWIGERDRDTGGVAVRTEAGIDDGARELFEAANSKNDWERPASEVLHTGELTVINDIESDERFPASVRRTITDSAVRSGIALPLSHGQTVYGVLAVYATRTDAFSEREAVGFEALGELVGFVIDAVESKRLLFADRVVELEFRVTDERSFFVSLSKEFGATCALEEIVPGEAGTLLEYGRIEGIPTDDVLERGEESNHIERIRAIDETLFEMTVVGASPVLTLTELGGSVTEAVVEDGAARIVAELPADVDVRNVVETFKGMFPSSELMGKRERERPTETVDELVADLEGDLTERQLAALRAAYMAGYFDWPRASTAEDVADALGISSPTLHQHLRKAESKVFSSFFAE
ncbi:bacterio-opsin activator domain-containing protein [Haladaptatus cibarius]|uniref:bacterio-opsin activator domain-containing protein n=1 Tax=Haladaptatus cibarius TaxID=453847 RepID=UPI0006787CE3|nr:bacterio-opsin activator domain-containing protein [Haladaptatus cibarius]